MEGELGKAWKKLGMVKKKNRVSPVFLQSRHHRIRMQVEFHGILAEYRAKNPNTIQIPMKDHIWFLGVHLNAVKILLLELLIF